jgi:hypothetical protein
MWQCRSRTDQAHIAAEHVDELRQLVQARAFEDPSDLRAPRVLGQLEQRPAFTLVGERQVDEALFGVGTRADFNADGAPSCPMWV